MSHMSHGEGGSNGEIPNSWMAYFMENPIRRNEQIAAVALS